jgi:hypothetical protein
MAGREKMLPSDSGNMNAMIYQVSLRKLGFFKNTWVNNIPDNVSFSDSTRIVSDSPRASFPRRRGNSSVGMGKGIGDTAVGGGGIGSAYVSSLILNGDSDDERSP